MPIVPYYSVIIIVGSIVSSGNIDRTFTEDEMKELPLKGFGEIEVPSTLSTLVLERVIEETLPGQFSLQQNYPNPFNPVTEIRYEIPVEGLVSLMVFNILGEEVAVLMNERQPQGNYTATLDAGILPSGVYIYRLVTGGHTSVQKCILMK